MGVGLIIGAIIALLNNVTGVKSGGSMPEQAGEPRPGQTSKTDTHTQSTGFPPGDDHAQK